MPTNQTEIRPARPRVSHRTVWALAAVCGTFIEAIVRLTARALNAFASGLTVTQWVGFAVAGLAFAYLEGYRALHQRFVPEVVARACAEGRSSGSLRALIAPAYALSLAGADRVTLIRSWGSVGMIVVAVLAVRALPDPWRGIIDGAVAIALSWGLAALVAECAKVLQLGARPSASYSLRPGPSSSSP